MEALFDELILKKVGFSKKYHWYDNELSVIIADLAPEWYQN